MTRGDCCLTDPSHPIPNDDDRKQHPNQPLAEMYIKGFEKVVASGSASPAQAAIML